MPYFKVKYRIHISDGTIPTREYESVSLGANEKHIREKYQNAGYDVISVAEFTN